MNYIKSFFTKGGNTDQEEQKQRQLDDYAPKDLSRLFTMEDFENILGVQLVDLQFC